MQLIGFAILLAAARATTVNLDAFETMADTAELVAQGLPQEGLFFTAPDGYRVFVHRDGRAYLKGATAAEVLGLDQMPELLRYIDYETPVYYLLDGRAFYFAPITGKKTLVGATPTYTVDELDQTMQSRASPEESPELNESDSRDFSDFFVPYEVPVVLSDDTKIQAVLASHAAKQAAAEKRFAYTDPTTKVAYDVMLRNGVWSFSLQGANKWAGFPTGQQQGWEREYLKATKKPVVEEASFSMSDGTKIVKDKTSKKWGVYDLVSSVWSELPEQALWQAEYLASLGNPTIPERSFKFTEGTAEYSMVCRDGDWGVLDAYSNWHKLPLDQQGPIEAKYVAATTPVSAPVEEFDYVNPKTGGSIRMSKRAGKWWMTHPGSGKEQLVPDAQQPGIQREYEAKNSRLGGARLPLGGARPPAPKLEEVIVKRISTGIKLKGPFMFDQANKTLYLNQAGATPRKITAAELADLKIEPKRSAADALSSLLD